MVLCGQLGSTPVDRNDYRPSYIPDAHRLAVSLAAIYADHPDSEGLPAARRIALTAAELAESDPSH